MAPGMEEILLRGIKRAKKSRQKSTRTSYDVQGKALPLLDTFDALSTKTPFSTPLLVQRLVIPYFLENVSVVVRSFTGSGKTLAYALPLIELSKKGALFAAVLVPSKALVRQVFRVVDEIRPEDLEIRGVYENVCVRDGTMEEHSADDLVAKRGILITTPEILAQDCSLGEITHLVIDEADVLINPSSLSLLGSILDRLDIKKIHFSCFSATMNDEVEEIVGSFNDVSKVSVEASKAVAHKFVFGTDERIKHLALLQLLGEGIESPALIFVKDADTGERLKGIVERSAVYDEKQRDSADIIDDFRLKKIWFLFTTDVLSRGVDFYNVRSVVSYDMPATKTQFVHRIGRINRNCEGQKAYTIYSRTDFKRLRAIVEFLDENRCAVPEYIRRLAAL
jgi:superfamily II DNA/RNA helicase